MKTPICDFVRRYTDGGALRLHMPGHKGSGEVERFDITEIKGADSLYEADGIIAESERNASGLFGCDTYYSTEGSSQCIRAMLWLASVYAKEQGRKPVVLAGRNAHKAFLSAAAIINFDIRWVYPDENESYLSCNIRAEKLESAFEEADVEVTAVYVTSPDYLGNVADIERISEVCHRHGALLLVDNAHGAYLRFLSPSRHPIDMGADICCDSAHKTLPVLTGGAYLHTGNKNFAQNAKTALALFGSTSPSYLILQSLDKANAYLAEGYKERLSALCKKAENFKCRLKDVGYSLVGNEPLKLTVYAKDCGYTGEELADILREKGMECEFADPDFLVLMLTPEIGESLNDISRVFEEIPKKEPVNKKAPTFSRPERVMSVREAAMSPMETVSAEESLGRILASASVGCPPAVPVVVCGERIDEASVECFKYYGIDKCIVVK